MALCPLSFGREKLLTCVDGVVEQRGDDASVHPFGLCQWWDDKYQMCAVAVLAAAVRVEGE